MPPCSLTGCLPLLHENVNSDAELSPLCNLPHAARQLQSQGIICGRTSCARRKETFRVTAGFLYNYVRHGENKLSKGKPTSSARMRLSLIVLLFCGLTFGQTPAPARATI